MMPIPLACLMVLTTSGLQLQANNGLDVGCPTTPAELYLPRYNCDEL